MNRRAAISGVRQSGGGELGHAAFAWGERVDPGPDLAAGSRADGEQFRASGGDERLCAVAVRELECSAERLARLSAPAGGRSAAPRSSSARASSSGTGADSSCTTALRSSAIASSRSAVAARIRFASPIADRQSPIGCRRLQQSAAPR
jgi:hypothetical protein